MSYRPVRCEHCGDPAAYLKSGAIAKFRGEPVCHVCAYLLGKDDHKSFMEFLKQGGKGGIGGGRGGRAGIRAGGWKQRGKR